MHRVGDKEIVFYTTFQTIGAEPALIEVNVKGLPLKLEFIFERGQHPDPPTSKWTFSDSIFRFKFNRWVNQLGTSTKGAIHLGVFQGQSFGLMLTHFLIGSTNLVHLQIVYGGTYPEHQHS